jgi:capsular polysaccharide biosynthesis protein
MSEMLLDRPLETKSSPLWSNNQTVCFKNLLVGTRGLGMSTASERIWPPFVAEIKSHFGLQLRPQPKAQKITVFRKNGRRTLTNYEEVADHLRKRFDVEVEVWEPATFSIRDQIKYLETTTVVVTPCGGVSFTSLFLPAGSSAIFVE